MHASSDGQVSGLEVLGIGCERGGRVLFSAIDFRIPRGASTMLLGPNGSGKSTLLRVVAGLAEPAVGRLRWDGRDVDTRRTAWRARVSYLGHKSGHKDDLTVAENLELACELDGGGGDEHDRFAALERLGLGRQRLLQVKRLSQGQRQRLALARLSLSRRPLWLLDEPTAALDADARALLAEVLAAHLGRGGALLVATHDPIALPATGCTQLHLG